MLLLTFGQQHGVHRFWLEAILGIIAANRVYSVSCLGYKLT